MSSIGIHFISGLPRSGSTLLAAILRQNPRFHASMSSPVAGIFSSLMQSMSGANAFSSQISDDQRYRILQSTVETFYAQQSTTKLIFDTSRRWCTVLPVLTHIFPGGRVLCCIRSPAWILDSIEQQVQRNAVQPSKLFNHDAASTVYSRVAMLVNGGFVSRALNGLRQAWFGEHANRLIAIRYDSLVERPNEIIDQLYDLLNEARFPHDYEHLEYDEPDFDADLGLPGFHRVATRVEYRKRATILPPDLFARYDERFWDLPGQNPRGVTVL